MTINMKKLFTSELPNATSIDWKEKFVEMEFYVLK
jgi:hypothetical protein